MRSNITDSFIIEYLNNINYTLISFIDSKHRVLKVQCLEGHVYITTWVNIYNKKRRCKKCAYLFRKRPKKKLDKIKLEEQLCSLGYEFFGIYKKDNLDYIMYKCINNHLYSTRLYDWIKGVRCGKCKGRKEIKISQIKDSFNKENYTLYTNYYKNNLSKLKYKCPLGHIGTTNWKLWQRNIRCPICFRLNNIGSNHYNWNGGKSFEPYCEVWKDQDYKKSILSRDNNTCQNPYCFKTTKKLSIHHIDYNKKNCHPNNLITLCIGCNSRANKHQDWHQEWYQALMSKKFGYNY